VTPIRTIIVGDVHGCREELERLLAAAGAGREDRVVLVGDLVAKGPDSQGVVQLVRERGYEAVLGNHDAKVLDIGRGAPEAGQHGGGEHARVARTLAPEDWSFLEALPLTVPLPALGAVVVHAGLIPGVPLAEQPRKFLLNLRSITPEGEPSKRIGDGAPWASLWRGPEHVVFGHDALRGLQQYPLATGLDTGCVYGGRLTALALPDRRLFSEPARRAYVPL
jgi:hypothetical protein